jgi:protein TonB
MRLASFSPFADRDRAPVGRRAIAFVIVVAIHILLALVLLLISPPNLVRPAGDDKVFTLLPDKSPEPQPAKAEKQAAKAAPKRRQVSRPITPPTPPVAPKEPGDKPFEKQLFDAIDIAQLPNYKDELAAAPGNDSGTADSVAANGPGAGPHGEKLYPAQWQREPTDAELAFYLPKRGIAEGSWATIACRTVERFRVEDCALLGESPPGSGLARAVLNAAWQFRVLPPRVGGKPQVGEWVSIRIDFSEKNRG